MDSWSQLAVFSVIINVVKNIYTSYPLILIGVFIDSLPHIKHLISSPVIPFFLRAVIVTLPTL